MTFNVAHRGASGYEKENTMAAFIKAVALGCDGIETDVQLSKDGIPVLIHDETVDRTTNSAGYVKDMTVEELKMLGIPTLKELLELAQQHDLILNLELKNGIVPYVGLEQMVIDLLKQYRMEQQVILSSFNHISMVICKRLAPEIMTGLLYMEHLYKPYKYCRYAEADALHPHFQTVSLGLIEAAHENGLKVNVYTVNEEEDIKQMVMWGVDMIISNYPDRVAKYTE